MFYNCPAENDPASRFPEVWPEPLPPGFRIVIMTPFGFSKPTKLGEKEIDWMYNQEQELYQWGEFNEGDHYPTICLKYDPRDNLYTTVRSGNSSVRTT